MNFTDQVWACLVYSQFFCLNTPTPNIPNPPCWYSSMVFSGLFWNWRGACDVLGVQAERERIENSELQRLAKVLARGGSPTNPRGPVGAAAVGAMTHSYAWHDSFVFVTHSPTNPHGPVGAAAVGAMTNFCVWHDSFVCETHSPWSSGCCCSGCHDSFTCVA